MRTSSTATSRLAGTKLADAKLAGSVPAGAVRSRRVWHLEGGGTRIAVTDRGASWLSCGLEMGGGVWREVLLGHDKPGLYGTQPGYLGAVVGRYANRIANARFTAPQGQTSELLPNEGCSQLHGGPDGFDKRDWQVLSHGPRQITFGLASPAGDQGFPGNLHAQVTYEVRPDGAVTIRFDTSVDAPCPVSLSSHGYFNLDGVNELGDHGDVLAHTLWVDAQQYLPVNVRLIPTGEFAAVGGTPFDFSRPARLQSALSRTHPQLSLGGGVDHCFVLNARCRGGESPAASLGSADGLLSMALSTSYPGLQCYSGNYLSGLPGRQGRTLQQHAGLALEPEYFPDSPNHPEWPQPSCWQQPGETRSHFVRFEFERHRIPLTSQF